MMKRITYALLSIFIYSLIGCSDKTQDNKSIEQENGWELEKRVTKTVDNLSFTFPAEGYAYDNRDVFVKNCFDAIIENCATINLPDYNNPIKITFQIVDKKWKKLLDIKLQDGLICGIKRFI